MCRLYLTGDGTGSIDPRVALDAIDRAGYYARLLLYWQLAIDHPVAAQRLWLLTDATPDDDRLVLRGAPGDPDAPHTAEEVAAWPAPRRAFLSLTDCGLYGPTGWNRAAVRAVAAFLGDGEEVAR